MATRSCIARKTQNGYEAVYCHWDGYPAYTGNLLLEHYKSSELVKELLSHGDISVLGPSIGQKHDFNDRPDEVTTFYHRDRDEEWTSVKPRNFDRVNGLKLWAEMCGCEYLYLWQHDAWYYACRGPQMFGLSDGSPLSRLKQLTKRITEPEVVS